MGKKGYKKSFSRLAERLSSVSFRSRLYLALRDLCIGFLLASVVNFVFSYFFYTPKMYRISRQNSELLLKYQILNDKIDAVRSTLDQLHHRDVSVYRPLLGADTLDMPSVYMPYSAAKYESMAYDRFSPVMVGSWRKLDDVARRMYLQSKSLDELQALSRDKEQMATAIPAIMPINKKDLKGIDMFGWRLHPIYHRMIYHKGMDLGSDRGNPVYATGNGRVVETNPRGTGRRGYGKHILIDHGFGYKTKYAHLNEILVQPGQQVRRGELIGRVGSTGGTTGPHLHYEVIYMGQHVNPVNYFRRDMNQQDFERIVESANKTFETDFGESEQ